ncbi:hypothetical protein AMS68_001620 [Peltaster fructicola]|uniref:Uncharacterized protein n=1 Tax=Peltaster fructicola TaxID=286661 RepID=A0A6H0XN04_9PEZI|nr:hypothetical protein AMS68_001620 [Peltaster fructicola]
MAGYAAVERPFAETFQNNRWNSRGRMAGPNRGPRRSAPEELPYLVQRNGVWKQGNRTIRDVKPNLYFVRPTDGKRAGASGRVLDCMTGEGPDVFVSKCGDKRTLMRDRPQRWQWSGWGLSDREWHDLRRYDKDYRRGDLSAVLDLPRNATARLKRSKYNYQSRKYESWRELPADPWTDARWAEGARRSDMAPLCFRDMGWQWYSRVPVNAGRFPGGRPRERW